MMHDREAVCISAATGENLDELQQKIESFFQESQVQMTLLVPFQDGGVITKLHALNAVRETEYVAEGTRLLVSLPLSEKDRFISYQIKE